MIDAVRRGGIFDIPLSRRFKRESVLAGILVLYFALGIIYSVITPVFEAPDEPGHLAFIYYLVENHSLPSESDPARPGYVPTGGHPPLYYILGALVTAWIVPSEPIAYLTNPYFEYGPESLGVNVFQHSAEEDFPYRGTALAVHILRVLGLLLGVGTIVATFQLARTLFPKDRSVPLGAAALVAFLPEFIFISASVNSDNLVNFFCALSLVQIVRVGIGQARRGRDLMWLGVLVGLANLSKASALILLPPAALAVLAAYKDLGWRALWRNSVISGAAFFATAGWWYIRNFALYGDALAGHWWARAYISGIRTEPLTLERAQDFVLSVFASFWAVFGWGNIAVAKSVYQLLSLAVVLSLAGVCYRVLRHWREPQFPRSGIALLALTVIGITLLLFYYLYGGAVTVDQGRYLFPALAPLAIFFIFGLGAFFSGRWRGAEAALVGGGLLAFATLVPFTILLPAYRPFTPPPPVTKAQVPANATRSGIVLLNRIGVYAFELSSDRVPRGGNVLLNIYWEATSTPGEDDNVSVDLVSADGRVLWSRARRPGRGRVPTDLWTPGEIVPDEFRLTLPADSLPGEAKILVSAELRRGESVSISSAQTEALLTTITIK